jgi:hypothetical protein
VLGGALGGGGGGGAGDGAALLQSTLGPQSATHIRVHRTRRSTAT